MVFSAIISFGCFLIVCNLFAHRSSYCERLNKVLKSTLSGAKSLHGVTSLSLFVISLLRQTIFPVPVCTVFLYFQLPESIQDLISYVAVCCLKAC